MIKNVCVFGGEGAGEGGMYVLTLSQTSPGFHVYAVQVLKTMWEKEKLLLFPHCLLSV